MNAELALFWATVALVGVTIFYAIQTWRLVRIPYTPRLKATFGGTYTTSNHTNKPFIKIENVGVGTAVDISGSYSIDESSFPISTTPFLRPNEKYIKIPLRELPPLEESNRYKTSKIVVRINLKFKNILNKKDKYKDTLDASDFAINYGTPTV